MKLLFAVVIFTVLAYTNAEQCSSNSACMQHGITHCGGGSHVVCQNNQCVCVTGPSGTSCTSQTDCPDCDHGNKHCIDASCRCTRF